jgi:hypothetical protein
MEGEDLYLVREEVDGGLEGITAKVQKSWPVVERQVVQWQMALLRGLKEVAIERVKFAWWQWQCAVRVVVGADMAGCMLDDGGYERNVRYFEEEEDNLRRDQQTWVSNKQNELIRVQGPRPMFDEACDWHGTCCRDQKGGVICNTLYHHSIIFI